MDTLRICPAPIQELASVTLGEIPAIYLRLGMMEVGLFFHDYFPQEHVVDRRYLWPTKLFPIVKLT